jgi:oxepin-CoA hydrolase/3-oxo-5,6-dehydrosuberyl-CoA semialdehyde dehydrogenase
MAALRSYVSGKWTTPEGDGQAVLDAVTGEEIARSRRQGSTSAPRRPTGGTPAGPPCGS